MALIFRYSLLEDIHDVVLMKSDRNTCAKNDKTERSSNPGKVCVKGFQKLLDHLTSTSDGNILASECPQFQAFSTSRKSAPCCFKHLILNHSENFVQNLTSWFPKKSWFSLGTRVGMSYSTGHCALLLMHPITMVSVKTGENV